MKKTFLSIIFLVCFLSHYGQTISLSFSAVDANTQYPIGLDSVRIENITLGCDTTISGASPTLFIPVIFNVQENDPNGGSSFQVMQNIPNPFRDITSINVFIPNTGVIQMALMDIIGNTLVEEVFELKTGFHQFEIKSDISGILLLSATDGHDVSAIKMVNYGYGNGINKIKYSGGISAGDDRNLKHIPVAFNDGFLFYNGNILKYTASITGYDDYIIQDSPKFDTSYKFQMSVTSALATVSTISLTNITSTTATCGGIVILDGGLPVTQRGVCWSTSHNPSTSDNHTVDGSGLGIFISNLTGLTQNSTYYIRAYAVNELGESYGTEYSFSAASTYYVGQYHEGGVIFYIDCSGMRGLISSTNDQSTGASWGCYGDYISTEAYIWSGNINTTTIIDECPEYGIAARVCRQYDGGGYNDWFLPSIDELNVLYEQKNIVGEFTSDYYWSSSQIYSIQAQAQSFFNGTINSYQKDALFYVRPIRSFGDPDLALVYTDAITNITGHSAKSGGIVVCENGASVTERGLCWSISPNPTLDDFHEVNGNGAGPFTGLMTDLLPVTTYYVRSYATNAEGTAYGNEISFNTNYDLPKVVTLSIDSITLYSAVVSGNVISDGGAYVTAKGVCWSTTPNPSLDDNFTVEGNGLGTFESHLTGLTPNTTYYVRAYATNIAGTTYGNEKIFVSMLSPLTIIAGYESKTWKLIRVTTTGRYPIEVGPYDHESIWWAMGLNNNEIANRACMLNDEWTFFPDGTFTFDAKGDYWAEGGVFDPANFCASTNDPMININGEDVSAWGNGTHQFVVGSGLTVNGNGAFVGFYKCANDFEVYDLTPMVQDEIDYKLIKLTDGDVDTLIVELDYYDNPETMTGYLGYWRHVLVHYDNPNDEPPIPSPAPVVGFTFTVDGTTVTFTNTSTLADSYLWDFGDGGTSIETNPIHTYTADGYYTVSLTAYNANGESTESQFVIISSGILTEEILTAGPWKLKVSDHSIYVGPAMGSDGWWICPLANLDGTMVGTTDDWSCMTDDEFIFHVSGGYEYKTNGGSRNDGYMGTPNGCWSDAEIAASPGAPFGSCATHTYTFTPADGTNRAIIELTNGPGFAAFLGFMKGYYGGENSNGANPPNGGFVTNRYEVISYINLGETEVLVVSVDLTSDHSGTSAWTMTLER